MEIKWLEDFLTLATTGNFRISAEQRNVSQPAFSRRIQALEAWVGTTLVDRSQQPSHLTEAGERYRIVAQDIVKMDARARDDILAVINVEKAKINFATLSTLAQFFMPSWLKSLGPFIDTDRFVVRTDFGGISDYHEALEKNIVDLFVCYEDPGVGFLGDASSFTSIKLGEDTLIPVVAPNENGVPIWWLPDNPKGPIPYLHTTSSPALWPIKQHIKKRYADLSFKTVYESSIATALKEMAIEGFGVAWVPNAIVSDDLANGRLVRAAKKEDDIVVDIKIYKCLKYKNGKTEKLWQTLLYNKV